MLDLAVRHLYLAGVPLLIGLLLALPLGWLARRYRPLYPPLIIGTGLLYTIPSLALFILMPGFIGTQILDPVNVLIAMTVYTIALLVRTVADGLGAVPDDVNQAATAMGYGRVARFFKVELPLAVPVISAGLRVAAVSNVSIVSVAAHHRRRPARLAVHRRLQPQLPRPDRGRHRRLRRAGPAAGRRHRGGHLAGHAVAARGEGADMNAMIAWLTDPAHWTGSDGVPDPHPRAPRATPSRRCSSPR